MLTKVIYASVAVMAFATGVVATTAGAQDCIYRDEYGEPIMHTGGAAIAAGIALMDPDGTWGIPADYNTWDLNADGIPDPVQFELLTNILCTSGIFVHPTIDFEEIRTTFEDNLALYWNLVNAAMAAEDAIAAGAPDLRQVGLEVRSAVNAAGIQDDPLPADVFGGTLPDDWVGRTWQDLGDILYNTGADINWMVTAGWLGQPGSLIWGLLDNTSTAYTMAGLLGFDTEFTTSLFNAGSVQTLKDFLVLHQLDWAYILGELMAYGLSATTVANVESSIDAMDLDESVLPAADTWAITSNGEDALDGDVLWGEDTLLDLYTNNGGDATALWEDIVTQLPELPVGGAFAALTMVASIALSGFFVATRKK